MSITVIGMGNLKNDLTIKGLEKIKNAEQVVLRTQKTQSAITLKGYGIEYISLDEIYDSIENFDKLNSVLADKVYELSNNKDIVYCIDGGGTDDLSADILVKKYGAEVIAGVSRESSALTITKQNANTVCGVTAIDFVSDRAFFAPSGTLIIKEIDNKYIASDVKLKLIELYGEINIQYIVDEIATEIKIEELDRQNSYKYNSMVVVPEKNYIKKARFSFSDLMAIVYRLRAKDGCKWDREQTHQSIRINCIEEAYELVEAIDLNDIDKMLEETGDVLLQGVFHAIIAEDIAEYTITDVLTVLCRKLLDRHTHIFGDVVANSPEEALAAWEAAKAKEKNQDSFTERMRQVAKNLPALTKAEKIQKIAKKANFDWDDEKGAIEKLFEEIEELKCASEDNREEEGGDLLFAAVNVLRHFDVEAETALLNSIKKFENRFSRVEEKVLQQGKQMKECSLEELDKIYLEIKDENR